MIEIHIAIPDKIRCAKCKQPLSRLHNFTFRIRFAVEQESTKAQVAFVCPKCYLYEKGKAKTEIRSIGVFEEIIIPDYFDEGEIDAEE